MPYHHFLFNSIAVFSFPFVFVDRATTNRYGCLCDRTTVTHTHSLVLSVSFLTDWLKMMTEQMRRSYKKQRSCLLHRTINRGNRVKLFFRKTKNLHIILTASCCSSSSNINLLLTRYGCLSNLMNAVVLTINLFSTVRHFLCACVLLLFLPHSARFTVKHSIGKVDSTHS